MKVLMLSTDNKIFEEGSAVRKRMTEYGQLFQELHIIVFSRRQIANRESQIAENIWVYPTNSRFKIFSFWDAFKISKSQIAKRKSPNDPRLALSDWLITAQDPFLTGLAGYLLKLRLKIPLQIQIHTDFLSPYFWQESFKNKIRVLLAKFLVKRADGIRVVSERIKRSLISNFQFLISKITVLPIFVDVKKIQNAPIKIDLHKKYPGRDFIILMASRLTREKNILMALEAIRGLTQTERGFTQKILLLIVGEGPEKENLELKTYNLQLQNNVVFEPWTNDLVSYYKTVDLFLLTSNYEGYGMSVVEAMAAGTPIVMTDVGLAGEIVENGKNGTVVPVSDSFALKEAINRAIQNRKAGKSKVTLRPAQGVLPELISKKHYLENYREALQDILLKPKLCYVLPKFNPEDSTHFVYLHDFLKSIAKNFSISLLVEKGDLPPEDFGYKEARLIKSAFLPLKIIEIFFKLLIARVKGNRDFYVHYSFGAAFLANIIVRIFSGRVFYWNCGEPWKYKRNFLRDWFERLVYKQVNLVTGTEGMKAQYSEHYNIPFERIFVMPNWINLRTRDWGLGTRADELRKKLNIKTDQKVILFVHRLSKRKGAHHLPEITQKLNFLLHDSSFIIIIVGDGPERENIELRIKNYGLSAKVRFLGAVPNYHLSIYYSLADVFIMPSDEEGFPHVLLEAMAYGVPFVVTDVGGVRDITPKAVRNLIVPSNDPEKFTKKILQILSKTKSERQIIGRLLKESVRRYDLKNSAEEFRKIIS